MTRHTARVRRTTPVTCAVPAVRSAVLAALEKLDWAALNALLAPPG